MFIDTPSQPNVRTLIGHSVACNILATDRCLSTHYLQVGVPQPQGVVPNHADVQAGLGISPTEARVAASARIQAAQAAGGLFTGRPAQPPPAGPGFQVKALKLSKALVYFVELCRADHLLLVGPLSRTVATPQKKSERLPQTTPTRAWSPTQKHPVGRIVCPLLNAAVTH